MRRFLLLCAAAECLHLAPRSGHRVRGRRGAALAAAPSDSERKAADARRIPFLAAPGGAACDAAAAAAARRIAGAAALGALVAVGAYATPAFASYGPSGAATTSTAPQRALRWNARLG